MVIGPNLKFYLANVESDITEAYARTILEHYGLAFDKAEEEWLEPEGGWSDVSTPEDLIFNILWRSREYRFHCRRFRLPQSPSP